MSNSIQVCRLCLNSCFCVLKLHNLFCLQEYILRVQRGSNKEDKWNVSRRYRDFAALHTSLQPANIELPLPPKKLIGNMQPSFIAERQIALQVCIMFESILKGSRVTWKLNNCVLQCMSNFIH